MGHDVDIFVSASVNKDLKVHPDVKTYKLLDRTYYQKMPTNKFLRFFSALGLIVTDFHKNPMVLLRSLNVFKYGKDAFSLRNLYYVLPFLDKDYDIIYCHFGPNGNYGVFLKDLGMRGKLVTTFHAYDLTSYVKKEGPHVYNHLFQKGDLFLAVSEIGKGKLVDIGCGENKILVHHMGVDIERFEFKERSRSHDAPIKVLTIGRLVEKKGINYAIKAVGLLIKKGYDLIYIIAGNGPLKSELDGLILQLGARGRIKIIGSVEQTVVKALMMDSDFFLLPSVTGSNGDQEGIPVTLMEAMATGMPVISTYHSGIPELVENGKSGFLVPERDVDALTDRLIYLIEHPELWPKMGREGREFVKKYYDIRKLNIKLETIYQSLLEGPGVGKK